jgi:hypothetical protein
MSQQQSEMNPFDAAKSIVEALKGLDKPSQTLAMRFATETLGLQSAVMSQPPAAVVSSSPPAPQPDLRGATHSTDIKQFTVHKAPKSDQQFAAVVAYYYRFEAPEAHRRDAIDKDALHKAARLAGRRDWNKKNWLSTLNNAKNSGYFDAAGSGQFQISSVGENLVAVALPGDGSQQPPKRKANRKKRPKKNIGAKKTAKPRG